MASKGNEMTTKHTHPMVFGRKQDGCPRCDELTAGAPVVRWSVQARQHEAAQWKREVDAHFAPGSRHALGGCGPVCTFGDW